MSKKDLVHYGKRSWWSGDVKTECGLTFKKGREQQKSGWSTSVTCPSCKSGKKHKH